jgi:hypothetical protein
MECHRTIPNLSGVASSGDLRPLGDQWDDKKWQQGDTQHGGNFQ